MNVRTFIDRPILSGVISVLMVLVGIIGLSQLALEQFPEIAPPTVRIMASYTGANAETVQKSVVVSTHRKDCIVIPQEATYEL